MKLRSCVFLICLVGVLGACQDDEEEIKPAEKVSRTVLAYMVDDTNLSSYLKTNFNDMVKGMQFVDDSDCNMLVYSKLSENAPCLIKLSKLNGKVVADTLLIYEDQNPLNKSVMTDVLSTAFTRFPADSYGLVFLSHAEGWVPASTSASRSIGVYRNTSMNIDEFQQVLSDVGKHLSFVLFDACFMQSIEVAYELRNNVDFLIGSPTEIPGPGAPYADVMECLFSKHEAALEIADAYFASYARKYTGAYPITNDNWTGGVSVSVIKSDALEQLAQKTEQIFFKYGTTTFSSNIMCYDRRSTKYYYDLNQVVYALTQGNSDYTNWKSAFMKARPYWETTAKNYSGSGGLFSMEGAEGVSTYIPSGISTSRANEYYRTYDWTIATGWGL